MKSQITNRNPQVALASGAHTDDIEFYMVQTQVQAQAEGLLPALTIPLKPV